MAEVRGQPVIGTLVKDLGVTGEKKNEMVVDSCSRVSPFDGRDNKSLFPKMRKAAFFHIFVEDYTQVNILFTVNKEEIRNTGAWCQDHQERERLFGLQRWGVLNLVLFSTAQF